MINDRDWLKKMINDVDMNKIVWQMRDEPASWRLRLNVADLLISWGVVAPDHNIMTGLGDDPVYQHLAWLLGYKDGNHMMSRFKDADRDKLQLLCGPHGRTIYHIMVLKKGAIDEVS